MAISYSWYEMPVRPTEYGMCLPSGDKLCAGVQQTANPSFELFQPPEDPDGAFPELVDLTRRMNRTFQRRARRVIHAEREKGRKPGADLRLDVVVRDHGLQLVFTVKEHGDHAAIPVEEVVKRGKGHGKGGVGHGGEGGGGPHQDAA